MRSLGDRYESKALKFLKQNGLKSVEMNFCCRVGEIDLIMNDKGVLVFVEVRYRRSEVYGNAKESIGPEKQKKIIKAAHMYLQSKKLYDWPCRFDTVTFNDSNTDETIEWCRSAFEETIT